MLNVWDGVIIIRSPSPASDSIFTNFFRITEICKGVAQKQPWMAIIFQLRQET